MTAEEIPDAFRDLFEKRAFAHLATLLPDGSPHVVPVWVDYDGEHVLVNTPRETRKERNVRRDARVALSVQDPENPYRFLAVRGEVVEITEEGAREHVNSLAKRYAGLDEYPRADRESNPRVVVRIRPDHVVTQAPPGSPRSEQ